MSIQVADLVASLRVSDSGFSSGMGRAEQAFQKVSGLARDMVGSMVSGAVKFQVSTQQLADNTTMGAAGLAQMRAGALALAGQTGQPIESLSEGFMHVANHAYSGAAMMNIASAAAKNAAATGGVASDDMNILAGVMREYGISNKEAAKNTGLATREMDILHNAVANSNWTMTQFTEGSKRAIATAGGMGVSLADVSSALAVLSEHGFPTASVASLNLSGVMRDIAGKHSPAVTAELQKLGKAAGVDLADDFTQAGLKSKGLFGVMQDLQKATHGNLVELRGVITQSSYATAAMGLIRGMPDLISTEQVTKAAALGQHIKGMVGTNEAFKAWSQTIAGQATIMDGKWQALSITLGTEFIPILSQLLTNMAPLISDVTQFATAHKGLTDTLLVGLAVMGPLGSTLRGLGSVLSLAAGATKLLSVAQGALDLVMDANPIALVVLGIAGLAVGAKLAYDHITPFRNGVNAAWKDVQAAAHWFTEGHHSLVLLAAPLAPLALAFGGLAAGFKLAYDHIGPFRNAMNGLGDLLSKLDGPLQGIAHLLGINIGQGISTGVKETQTQTQAAMAAHLKALHDAARKDPNVRAASPSQTYREVGRDMMRGMALGITDGSSLAASAMAQALSGLRSGRGTSGLGGASPVNATTTLDVAGISTALAAGGGTSTVTVNVTLQSEARVSVAGRGALADRALWQKIGTEIVQALDQAERRAGVPARPLQPGARSA